MPPERVRPEPGGTPARGRAAQSAVRPVPGAAVAPDQRRRLETLVGLTHRAIEAARAGDVAALQELDGQRREVIGRLRGAGTDASCASLALEARTLDRRLAETAVAARDALGARVRGLHAVGRAQRGYAATESLGTDRHRA